MSKALLILTENIISYSEIICNSVSSCNSIKLKFYIKQHAYADHSGIYYNSHLRDAFIEDLVLFDEYFRLKDCGKDDPEPSA